MSKFILLTDELKDSFKKDSKKQVIDKIVSNPKLSSMLTDEQKQEAENIIHHRDRVKIGHVKSAQRHWFGIKYKKEREEKLKNHKSKNWLQKLYDEIELEIDNELFDCRMEPHITSEKMARELCIKRQLIKMGRPFYFFGNV